MPGAKFGSSITKRLPCLLHGFQIAFERLDLGFLVGSQLSSRGFEFFEFGELFFET
jgi:hypothetical protein